MGVTWKPDGSALKLREGTVRRAGVIKNGASGRSIRDSAPEAWPSEVRTLPWARIQLATNAGLVKGRIGLDRGGVCSKGVKRSFNRRSPQARYCSPECRAAARRWRQRQASRQYRRTVNGQEKRQAQSRRYRCRCAERRRAAQARDADVEGSDTACGDEIPPPEGQRPGDDSGFSCCDRPGCYEPFAPSKRSPCQRFCSSSCRQALRRVIERERRWWQRARRARRNRPKGRCRGP